MTSSEFDYVIVGAGSAGCVVAARLSEDPTVRVLLVESGGWDKSPWIKIPLGWGRLLDSPLFDWGLQSEPESNLYGRRLPVKRGKVIGGSSSTNAMAYVRGNAADYDRWAGSGLPGWGYADVLPIFVEQEHWHGAPSAYRGAHGPLDTQPSGYADPVIDAWIEAGSQAGFPITDDYNGASQEGLSRLQATIGSGRRASAASAFLRPALRRKNLTVWTKAQVQKVVIEHGRATGISALVGGEVRAVRATREVILSAGVFHSPQLLLLSGVGDPDALAAHAIPVRAALPGVGRNLQDHFWANVEFERSDGGLFLSEMRLDRVILGLIEAAILRTGFWTDMPSGWTAFLKTEPSLDIPNIQLLFRALHRDAAPWFPLYRAPGADGFSCRAVLLRPESRGRVELASPDPMASPRITFNFMATERDRATLRAGIRLIRTIAAQPALAPFIAGELAPGASATSDSELDAFIRRNSATSNHPAGTCRMGASDDENAVVDSELRVRGIEGLRVVDASVMPDLVGGNINAAVLMIAERAARLIRGRGSRLLHAN